MTLGRILSYLGIVVAGLFGLTIVFGSWYTIDQGARGVVLRNGAYLETADPGLHFKLPWVDAVHEVSVQSDARSYDKMGVYSRDQQPAVIRVSINYRVPPDRVAQVYSEFGGTDGLLSRLVDRQAYEKIKNVFGRYNALNAIQERGRLNIDITEAVQSGLKNSPIIIESVQLENIDFSDGYESAIEARMLQEVEVEKVKQQALREKIQADIAVTQAEGRASSKLAEAKAAAEATRLQGEAEAAAIQARGAALRENPGIPALIQAERWDGKLPTSMPPGGYVPFINVK